MMFKCNRRPAKELELQVMCLQRYASDVNAYLCSLLLQQATETQTHRWNLYVRGANGEEITHIVKKARPGTLKLRAVAFTLCKYS